MNADNARDNDGDFVLDLLNTDCRRADLMAWPAPDLCAYVLDAELDALPCGVVYARGSRKTVEARARSGPPLRSILAKKSPPG